MKTLHLRPSYNEVVSLGITRDADDSAINAFDSVCGFLNTGKLPIPNRPKQIIGESPQVSVLILPDYQNNGMLEDVCLKAVTTDRAIQCVDDYFKCVYSTVGREPKNKDIAKARLRVWLASQIAPDKRLGEAAQAGYFNWDSPAFDGLKLFLQAL
nr:DUF3226 domain-containing protein [Cylindrospermum stagnale]